MSDAYDKWRSCERKVKYTTPGQAKKATRRKHLKKRNMIVYPCRHCKGFHIARKTKR